MWVRARSARRPGSGVVVGPVWLHLQPVRPPSAVGRSIRARAGARHTRARVFGRRRRRPPPALTRKRHAHAHAHAFRRRARRFPPRALSSRGHCSRGRAPFQNTYRSVLDPTAAKTDYYATGMAITVSVSTAIFNIVVETIVTTMTEWECHLTWSSFRFCTSLPPPPPPPPSLPRPPTPRLLFSSLCVQLNASFSQLSLSLVL